MLPRDRDELIGGALGRGLFELLRQRLIREVIVTNPAAGADWTQAVPAGVAWEILHVHGLYTASAVVATRTPGLVARDPNNLRIANYSPGATLTASGAAQYDWGAGLGYTANISSDQSGLDNPPLVLPAGYLIQAATANKDAGDQWTEVSLQVREWSIVGVQNGLDWLRATLR